MRDPAVLRFLGILAKCLRRQARAISEQRKLANIIQLPGQLFHSRLTEPRADFGEQPLVRRCAIGIARRGRESLIQPDRTACVLGPDPDLEQPAVRLQELTTDDELLDDGIVRHDAHGAPVAGCGQRAPQREGQVTCLDLAYAWKNTDLRVRGRILGQARAENRNRNVERRRFGHVGHGRKCRHRQRQQHAETDVPQAADAHSSIALVLQTRFMVSVSMQ